MSQRMRRAERWAATEKVRIAFSTDEGSRQEVQGELVDISTFGARVKLRTGVPMHSYVLIQGFSGKLRGNASVRYCQRHWGFYYVGLEFSGFRFDVDALTSPVQSTANAG